MVRLPKAFRFEADEVRIRREGSRVVLEPIGGDWLHAVTGPVDAAFAARAREAPPVQEGHELNDLFE